MTTADGKAVTGKDLEMELEKDIPDPEKTNSEEQVTLPDVENTESKPEAEKISYGWRHYITLLSGLLSMVCVEHARPYSFRSKWLMLAPVLRVSRDDDRLDCDPTDHG